MSYTTLYRIHTNSVVAGAIVDMDGNILLTLSSYKGKKIEDLLGFCKQNRWKFEEVRT